MGQTPGYAGRAGTPQIEYVPKLSEKSSQCHPCVPNTPPPAYPTPEYHMGRCQSTPSIHPYAIPRLGLVWESACVRRMAAAKSQLSKPLRQKLEQKIYWICDGFGKICNRDPSTRKSKSFKKIGKFITDVPTNIPHILPPPGRKHGQMPGGFIRQYSPRNNLGLLKGSFSTIKSSKFQKICSGTKSERVPSLKRQKYEEKRLGRCQGAENQRA